MALTSPLVKIDFSRLKSISLKSIKKFFDQQKITENFWELGVIEVHGAPKKGVLGVIEAHLWGVTIAPFICRVLAIFEKYKFKEFCRWERCGANKNRARLGHSWDTAEISHLQTNTIQRLVEI